MGFSDIADSVEGNGKVVIATSLIMLVFVVLVSSIVFFISVKPAEQVLVPNIEGKKLEDAMLELQVKQLYPRLQLRFTDNNKDTGLILEQSPPAGTIVRAGKRINVVVSRGAVINSVGNYVGKTLTDVQQQLATVFSAGHKQLITIREPVMYKHSSIPAGTILEQNPAPETKISENTVIEFIVSKGPENEVVLVPDLQGINLAGLYSAMEKNKLTFKIKVSADPATTAPIVRGQTPAADSSAEAYSSLNITLNVPEKGGELIYGIYSPRLPKYPYPVKISLDAVYPDGKREELVSFRHTGGNCDLPYAVPQGTVLLLTVLNKQVQTFEVK